MLHTNAVLEMMGANGLTVDLPACVINASSPAAAGFQFMYVGEEGAPKAVMLVDLGKPSA